MLGRIAVRQVTSAHNSVIPSRLRRPRSRRRLWTRCATVRRPAAQGRNLPIAAGKAMKHASGWRQEGMFSYCIAEMAVCILLICRDILRSRRKQFYLQPSARALLSDGLHPSSTRPGRPRATRPRLAHHGWSLRPMKYFPIFADLDKAHVLVVGGGEQAAQKVRLLRKTKARSRSSPRPSPMSFASSRRRTPSGSCCACSWRAIWKARASFMRRPATACSTPRCRVPPRPGVSPSTSSMQQSSPPSSCRLSSTARR